MATHEKIKIAAVELFFERSYTSTRMKDIAEACGLTAGALYNHYSSKDELLYSIINESIVAIWSELDLIRAKGTKNPTDELYKYIFTYAKYHAEHSHSALTGNTYFKFLSDEYKQVVVEKRKQLRGLFESVIERGVSEGYFNLPSSVEKRPTRVATVAMFDMTLRVAEWYRPESGYSVDEIAEFYADLALRMVGAKRKKTAKV
jgi:AcrR family transcriptional regulator